MFLKQCSCKSKENFIFFHIILVICSFSFLTLCKAKDSSSYASGNTFAIATDHALASEAGKIVFQKGGNVFDAYVAASFAISVLRPQSTGLAGGGFALVKSAKSGSIEAYDFRERAPQLASENMYLDSKGEIIENQSLFGYKAVGVPGNVKGLLSIHKRYGYLSLEQVLEPALRLANEGFSVYEDLHIAIDKSKEEMNDAARSIFLRNGNALKTGSVLVQKDLGNTIQKIILNGEKEFYELETANSIVRSMQLNKGLISLKDLKDYKVIERKPLKITYKQYEIISFPPPSSGVFLFEILKFLEHQNIQSLFTDDPTAYYRLLIEAMKQGYEDRSIHGGDPDFSFVPVEALLSRDYLADRTIEVLRKSRADVKSSGEIPKTLESYNTTHISVMDSMGNAVSSTHSVNYIFGSRIVIPGTGLIMNDTMDDFATSVGSSNAYGLVGGSKNLIEANKTPLSSMSPTFIQENGQMLIAIGAPGGSFIPTAILQTILNRLEFAMSPYEAVASPRVHHQNQPNFVFAEQNLSNKLKALEEFGYKFKFTENRAKVFMVEREKNGHLHAVSDPRGQGTPSAY